MPQSWPTLSRELGKEFFEEFERGETFTKVLEYVTERHDADTEEYYLELRTRLGDVVREMLNIMSWQLSTGETSNIAAKLEGGQVKMLGSNASSSSSADPMLLLDGNVVMGLFDRARRAVEARSKRTDENENENS